MRGKRLRVPRARARGAREAGGAAKGAPRARPLGRLRWRARRPERRAPAEINLVGLTVDEALPRVDKLLDDAALSDRHEMRVVHGFGEGKLRRRSRASWRATRTSRRFRVGGRERRRRRGTIVELRRTRWPSPTPSSKRSAAPPTSCASSPTTWRSRRWAPRGRACAPSTRRRRPSFNVRSEPAVFHCFGCGEGGDVFKFVMLHERVPFPEAIESLARRFGVPVPESRDEAGPDRKEREEMLALMEAAAEHFSRHALDRAGDQGSRVPAGPRLQEGDARADPRGGGPRFVGRPAAARCGQVRAREALLTAGLVLERQGKEGHYDRFRNRAVFPILNESGKVVGLRRAQPRRQRAQVPELAGDADLPEEPRRSTASPGRGTPSAEEARVVLMEGYLDVARALEAGVDGGGGDLRHRAHAGPRPAPAPLRGEGGAQLRPGRRGPEGRAQEPRRALEEGLRVHGGGAARRATTPTAS